MTEKQTGEAGPDPIGRRLQERIAYHNAKLAEERAAAEARVERRRRLKRLLGFGFLGAD